MTTTQQLNDAQMEAAAEAQAMRDDIPQEAGSLEVARILVAEGHELFRDFALSQIPDLDALGGPAEGVTDGGASVTDGGASIQTYGDAQLPAAPRDQGRMLPAARAGVVEGQEELGAEDFELPRLKLCQEQTVDAEVEPGKFFLSLAPDEPIDSVVMVVLSTGPGRVFNLPYGDSAQAEQARDAILSRVNRNVPDGASAICRSHDRVFPDPELGWEPLAKRCADCAHAKWTTLKSGKRARDCQEVYDAIAVIIAINGEEELMPARWWIGGGATRTIRRHNTRIQMAAKRAEAKGLDAPAYGFSVVLTAKKKAGDDWFSPVLSPPVLLEPDQVEEMRGHYAALVKGHELPERVQKGLHDRQASAHP